VAETSGVFGYAEQVAIVIAEDKMNRLRKVFGQEWDGERRAQIAATDQGVGCLKGGQGSA